MMAERCKLNDEELRLFDYLRELSQEQGHEMSVRVCRRGSRLMPINMVVGNEGGTYRPEVCPEGWREAYIAHTHPGEESPYPSNVDLEHSFIHNSFCVIGTKETMCAKGLHDIRFRKGRVYPELMENLYQDYAYLDCGYSDWMDQYEIKKCVWGRLLDDFGPELEECRI